MGATGSQVHDTDSEFRQVRLRYIFEVVVEVPAQATADEIEFARNQAGWCATNALDEIRARGIPVPVGGEDEIEEDICVCSLFRAEYVGEAKSA